MELREYGESLGCFQSGGGSTGELTARGSSRAEISDDERPILIIVIVI